MRKVFRHEHNQDYWDRRWAEAGRDEDEFRNLDIYPVKYAEMVMAGSDGPVLELGSGLGRVVKHYRARGKDILGVERSSAAIDRLSGEPHGAYTVQADAAKLPFADDAFETVLAFGLFHNMEHGMDEALGEAARVLRRGGRFCISMRPDNLEMRLNERYWQWRAKAGAEARTEFHKWLVGEREFSEKLAGHGLRAESVHRARNMSILYRIPFFRNSGESESVKRSRGYRLNGAGAALDNVLTSLFPQSFCNVLVFLGVKESA